jgi:hypothetical protein
MRLQQETPLLRLHEERSKGQRRKRLRSSQVEALLVNYKRHLKLRAERKKGYAVVVG